MSKTTDNPSTAAPDLDKAVAAAMKEAAERIQNTHLPTHWNDCIEYLDQNFAFFLTHVLNMGAPEWDGSIPTAAVMLPAKGQTFEDDFRFAFNPTFAALLDSDELAFVAAHETLHILLNHLKLIEKGKQRGKFSDPKKFNVAADCVINDYLVSMGLNPGRVRKFGMFGPDVVGYDCANATVSEVYVDIPDDPQGGEGEGECGGGEGCGGEGNCDGSCEGDGLDKYMEGMGQGAGTGSHDWLHDPQAGQADAAEKIGEDTKKNAGTPTDIEDKKQDDDNKGTPGAGPGSEAGAMRNFAEQKGVSMKWAELIKEVNPDYFNKRGPRPRPSYHQPRRKLQGVISHYGADRMGILPVSREPDSHKGKMPSIVMYADGSGSCGAYIDTFCTLMKSVDTSKIRLQAFSFSTYVVPFDPLSDNNKIASGGTAFSPIEESIQKDVVPELGHYPTAVVVLTDLEGGFSNPLPEKKNQDSWVWLATYGGQYDYRGANKFGKVLDIDKFCEGMSNLPARRSSRW
jgi:hypothetical protein